MTDSKSPGDRLLELVVFGPTGLAVTLVEEFPKFVEKGRHRVEGQVHTARLVGQVAFQMGRRQLEQSLGHLGGQATGHHDDGADTDRADADVRARPRPDCVPGLVPGHVARCGPVPGDGPEARYDARPSVGVAGGWCARTEATRRRRSPSPATTACRRRRWSSGSKASRRPSSRRCAPTRHAHRQRRTILHRVEQLLAGGDGVAT